MRPQTTYLAIILSLSSLIPCGSSHPFTARRSYLLNALTRRSPYAVVPVDGGLSSSHSDGGPSITPGHPAFSTIAVAGTPTSIETEIVTLPPITDYLTSTKVIEGPTVTKTSEVTITPLASLVTITRTSYSIVDISSPSSHATISSGMTHQTSDEPSTASALPASPPDTTIDHTTKTPEPECTETLTSTSQVSSLTTQFIPMSSGISGYLLHNQSYPSNSSFFMSTSVASTFNTKTKIAARPTPRMHGVIQ